MTEPLIQMKLSLPSDLIAYVKQAAARNDRTPSGMIRFWIVEQKRREPPAEGVPWGETIPPIPPTVQGTAEGRERITKLRDELQKIRHRQRIHADTGADEDRAVRINFEIETIRKQIDLVTRMLPSNGGSQNG
jgi:hypothetical protein